LALDWLALDWLALDGCCLALDWFSIGFGLALERLSSGSRLGFDWLSIDVMDSDADPERKGTFENVVPYVLARGEAANDVRQSDLTQDTLQGSRRSQ
jgi:hypothetical protein